MPSLKNKKSLRKSKQSRSKSLRKSRSRSLRKSRQSRSKSLRKSLKRKSLKKKGGGYISYTFDLGDRISNMPSVVRVKN